MSAFPLPPDGSGPPPRPCDAPGCTEPAVLQWTRLASPAELSNLTVPAGESTVRLAVFGCAGHALPLEPAALLHEATCPWPAPCTCTGGAA